MKRKLRHFIAPRQLAPRKLEGFVRYDRRVRNMVNAIGSELEWTPDDYILEPKVKFTPDNELRCEIGWFNKQVGIDYGKLADYRLPESTSNKLVFKWLYEVVDNIVNKLLAYTIIGYLNHCNPYGYNLNVDFCHSLGISPYWTIVLYPTEAAWAGKIAYRIASPVPQRMDYSTPLSMRGPSLVKAYEADVMELALQTHRNQRLLYIGLMPELHTVAVFDDAYHLEF